MLTVFLSASVPSVERAARFRRTEHAAFEIEQAVVSLARAIFARNGRLVFGGHPTISPLVTMVAGEYRAQRRAESGAEPQPPSTLIYQSEAYREVAQEAKLLMYALGAARIVWTEAVGGERFDPERRGVPQCPGSLEAMRQRMLRDTNPDAMVCIGGMEGVLEEVTMFSDLSSKGRIFVLKTTGGAAAQLAEAGDARVEDAETELLTGLASLRAHLPAADEVAGGRVRPDDEEPTTPYPLIFQTLVARLLGSGDYG